MIPLIPSSSTRTRILVNQNIIRSNKKAGTRDPVLMVETAESNHYAHEVVIDGPSHIVYSPDQPLSCGARVWIETTAPVLSIRYNDKPWEMPDSLALRVK